MEIIKKEKKLCLSCMQEHDVLTVEVIDKELFKDEEVEFKAIYKYCSKTDEFLETEEMIRLNNLSLKDAYRKKVGLLTSNEIVDIREQYSVSQKDFSEILCWGKATITRYENHQVQSRVHDDVLRKISNDPQWFLEMLDRSKNNISSKAYKKYYDKAKSESKRLQNKYRIDLIKSIYAEYPISDINGKVSLDLDKVTDAVNYIASKVSNVHKVKLMKMLWYSDSLNFKRTGKGITGLVYLSFPMGALPEGHEEIMELKNIKYEIVDYGNYIGYKFKPIKNFKIKKLSDSEINVLDSVIEKVGDLSTNDIVDVMHEEDAYRLTTENAVLNYQYATKLSID